MANVEFCEHDWPGSGCKECRAEREKRQEFEAVIERHRTAIGATKVHIDYNFNSSPEELEQALTNLREMDSVYDSIDDLTKAEAKIKRLCGILKEIGELGTTDVLEWVKNGYKENPELSELKHQINKLTAFYDSIDQAQTIAYARAKGVLV